MANATETRAAHFERLQCLISDAGEHFVSCFHIRFINFHHLAKQAQNDHISIKFEFNKPIYGYRVVFAVSKTPLSTVRN